MNKLLPLLLISQVQAAEFKRELAPDRPDTTESPYTVEAGRFQVESSLWAYAQDKSDGVRTENWTLGEVNLKAGLSDCHDLQLVLRPWISEESEGETSEGFGDIELRLKWNLWGNDSGKTAGAVMPYVSVPTQTQVSSGEWEGGVIFPVAFELTERLGLGVQVEAARGWDDESTEYDWIFLHSAVLGFSLTEKIGMFIEYVGIAGDQPYQAIANTGVTYALTDDLQLDVIAGFGINEAAEDFSIAQGITFRF